MYQGKLVRLRALEQKDIAASHLFVNDYETMRGVTSGKLYPASYEDEARWAQGQSSYTHGEYQFAIETLEEGIFIGRCGFTRVDWKNRLAEIGILIGDGAFRGKGFGSDAVDTLCRFGFEELNLHKIKASVFSFNEAAIRAYQKCGFQEEGILKAELFREGKYHDVRLFALFSSSRL
ncbi:MAG: GNAT family N-acetyltransferase [Clostridia bacterium]|nr:GNAT family N-acetyltransferase [Clostridia bacterium]